MLEFCAYNDKTARLFGLRLLMGRCFLRAGVPMLGVSLAGVGIPCYPLLYGWLLPGFFGLTWLAAGLALRLSGAPRTGRHVFTLRSASLFIDGGEVADPWRIKLYEFGSCLFLKYGRTWFRFPAEGIREPLWERVEIQPDHRVHMKLPYLPEEERIDLLNEQIDRNNLCRLFRSGDRRHIVYICRRADGTFTVGSERLYLTGEDEIYTRVYGWWAPDREAVSIFETPEQAYREIEDQVAGYDELPL